MPLPDRSHFETAYAGEAPWDVDRPQSAFVEAADKIEGSILDSGCGTGENALYFASRGNKVMGIDFLDCCVRIEKEFGLDRRELDIEKLGDSRDARGTLIGVTAADIARWVEVCSAGKGKSLPAALWPRVQACIAATVSLPPESVSPTSRIIEDLGFT